jgi:pilus assembly protein CpaF
MDHSGNSIWLLLKDLETKKGITEIIINGINHVFIEREGELIRLNVQINAEDIPVFCEDVAKSNKIQFSANHPILDGTLKDGSRINIIHQAYTNIFPAITIRKYLRDISSFDKLDGKFNISNKWIQFFRALVKSRSNIIISGGTGVGKTTFLNLMLQEIAPTERIITIEDTKELVVRASNCVRLFTANTSSQVNNPLGMRPLVKNTLRMRPDRIIIGEVRGSEAFDLLQSMNTGHDGSMCTIHANSPSEALMRFENLFLLAGYDVPIKVVRNQISTAVDYIIQIDKDRELGRVVSRITEVSHMEQDVILLQDIGIRSEMGPEFTGLVPTRIQKLIDVGLPENFFSEV